ncbi:MAG: ATP-dependent DNA helicase [Myxococcota bacterium]
MISLDERARTLSLDVDDLVDAGSPPRRETAAGRERLEADARARYLEREAPAGYREETELGHDFTWREYRVHLSGRADGVYDRDAGAVVEVHRFTPLEGPSSVERSVERAGLLCLLLHRSGTEVHKGTLVDLSLVDAHVHRLDVAFSAETYDRLLDARLDTIERTWRNGRERARRKSTQAVELRFPFAEVRTGQDAMLRDVEGAATSGLILLCSAPTGIGKTAAALHPMLKCALAEDRTLFFITARVAQQELALETLRLQLPGGEPGFALQISAKDRLCPQEKLGCVERSCPLLLRFAQRLADSGLLEELPRLGVVESAELRRRALAADLCPFEVSLALSLEATVVVSDFNYVFDPNAYLRRFFDADHGDCLLIVDEAHQLPERARESYSAELDRARLEALAGDCAAQGLATYREAAELLRAVSDHCEQTARTLAEERSAPGLWVEEPDRRFWEEIGVRVEETIVRYSVWVAQEHERPEAFAPRRQPRSGLLRDPLLATLYTIRDFSRASQHDPELFAALWSVEGVRLLCLDPAALLGPRIRGFHAVVCMSATLTPLDFYASLLGVEGPRAIELDLGSPFPRENRVVLSVPSVETTYHRRADNAVRIGAIIARCLRVRRGNYLAFFPSFAYRDEVLAKMEPGPYRLLIQTPAMPTESFLEQLRSNHSETLLLCGVLGGVFAEGVDYPGEMAVGVFVVGPGLPAVSAERELIRAYYQQRRGSGFEYAYVYPGLSRVIQAGGRALRTPSDRAAIVLLGRRFSESPYRDPLPEWWREDLERTDDPAARLRAFWKRGDPLVPCSS